MAERHGQPVPSQSVQLSGKVYADGHASRTGICGLDRASWALVEVDSHGAVTAIVRGVVPRTYPQTSQASEFFAGSYASQILHGESVLHDDCANVVQSFARPRQHWCSEKFHYAGLMKQVLAQVPHSRLDDQSVVKVKAHVEFTDPGLTEQEAFDAWGNHEADRHADLAENLPPAGRLHRGDSVSSDLRHATGHPGHRRSAPSVAVFITALCSRESGCAARSQTTGAT